MKTSWAKFVGTNSINTQEQQQQMHPPHPPNLNKRRWSKNSSTRARLNKKIVRILKERDKKEGNEVEKERTSLQENDDGSGKERDASFQQGEQDHKNLATVKRKHSPLICSLEC